MKKGSVKNTRINAEVMRELSVAIRDLKDPRVSPMTSVTGAEVTPDLQYCKVYISVLGSAHRDELIRKVNEEDAAKRSPEVDTSVSAEDTESSSEDSEEAPSDEV